MLNDQAGARRRELGDFVRAQREKLTPAAAGLLTGGRRRTPGLRREEVAQIAGFSTTWYTWLEQGRDVSMSPSSLARLARALGLGRAERAYLFELAGRRDPDPGADDADDLPPAVAAAVAAVRAPAYVLDRYWNARAWNRAAERLFVGWLDTPGERNLLRFIFQAPGARTLIRGWEQRARRVVAEFRAHSGAYLNDRALLRLIEDLRAESAEFAQFWDRHGVLGREGGERTFDHPTGGFLTYVQITFDLASRPDFKLTVLVTQA